MSSVREKKLFLATVNLGSVIIHFSRKVKKDSAEIIAINALKDGEVVISADNFHVAVGRPTLHTNDGCGILTSQENEKDYIYFPSGILRSGIR